MRALHQLIFSVGRSPQASAVLSYRVTDLLHGERCVRVSIEGIARIVTAWLAELDAASPMVEQLVCAVKCDDWPTAHALADHLSIDVAVAA